MFHLPVKWRDRNKVAILMLDDEIEQKKYEIETLKKRIK